MNKFQKEEIQKVLKEEANQLAILDNDKIFNNMHYRIKIIVLREIDRLRSLAESLENIKE